MDCLAHGAAKSQTGLSDFHFHSQSIIRQWLYFPVLYNISLLLICFYTQSFRFFKPVPLSCSSPLITTNLFFVSESVSVFQIGSFVSYLWFDI